MNTRLDNFWKEYFGPTWSAIIGLVPKFGAIMLDLEQREYRLDDYAKKILGIKNGEDFDRVREVIESFAVAGNDDAKLKVVFSSGVLFVGIAYSEVEKRAAISENLEIVSSNKDREEMLLSAVLDEGKLYYAFQPIVNAHTGAIDAYEALIRTNEEIGLSPFELLNLAEKYDRMYDVERATFFSTLDFLAHNQISFSQKKLYINSMPAYLLTDADWSRLEDAYGELLEKIVVEMTESSELTDSDLDIIHNRLKKNKMLSAIDDYGTGYSNMSNILRYDPMVVKIDRSLIQGIDTNRKMQKLVAGIVESLHGSGYMALAEGIETRGELEYMINVGADLLQGFYLSKPKPILIETISENIAGEIKAINQELSAEVIRAYHSKDNEKISLSYLMENRYTMLIIDTSNITIIGDVNSKPAALNIYVKENTNCTLNLLNANIISSNSEPVLTLGLNSHLVINCDGENYLHRKGVFVPETSSILFTGDGDITIKSEMKDTFAIGTDSKNAHGDIELRPGGKMNIIANGDHFICVGGGKRGENSKIKLNGGYYSFVGTGASGLGIGTVNGDSIVEVCDCEINMDIQSSDSIQIGSEKGKTNINIENTYYSGEGSGKHQTGIGVLESGEGDVKVKNSVLNISMKGELLTYVGTYAGALNAKVKNSKIVAFGEGANIVCIGDLEGAGNYEMENLELDIKLNSGNLHEFGSKNGKLNRINC